MYFAVFFCRGEVPKSSDLLVNDDIVKLKRCVFSAQRSDLPPICTHNVIDDHKDPVLNALRRCKLFNNRHDRVKVYECALIFYLEILHAFFIIIIMSFDYDIGYILSGDLPSGISELFESTFPYGLRRVRERLPFRCIPFLLWTLGLHSR